MILVRVPDAKRAFEGMKARGVLVKNVAGLHPLLAELPAPDRGHAGRERRHDRGPESEPMSPPDRPKSECTACAARRLMTASPTSSATPRKRRSACASNLDGTRRGQARHRHRLLRPHARPDRPPRADRPRDRRQGRPAHRRPPHGGGRRHHARPGGGEGGGRQEGHAPLRPRLRAAGRGAVARGDRLLRPAGPAHATCPSRAA